MKAFDGQREAAKSKSPAKEALHQQPQAVISFEDKRPEALQLKKLQEMASQSARSQKNFQLQKAGYRSVGFPVIQRQVEKDSDDKTHTLLIDDKDFVKESFQVYAYLKEKELLDGFLNKEIHIQKAEGTRGKVCHHWSFGGLTDGFGLNISEIHEAFAGAFEESEFGPEIPGPLAWNGLGNTNGLDQYGTTKPTSIRVYENMAHSSRLQDGMWWHKFSENEFIFAIKGGDNNLIYSGADEIRVKALVSSIAGKKSKFSYVKKWNSVPSKNRYDHTNELLDRKDLDRNVGTSRKK